MSDFAKKQNIKSYWIAGNDIKKEGRWVNQAGKSLKYTFWNKGEPNNYGKKEDCIEVGHHGGFKWNDINCNSKYHFICERVKSVVTSSGSMQIVSLKVT